MVQMGWLRRERTKELLFAAKELFTFSAFEGVNGVVEEEEDEERLFCCCSRAFPFSAFKGANVVVEEEWCSQGGRS